MWNIHFDMWIAYVHVWLDLHVDHNFHIRMFTGATFTSVSGSTAPSTLVPGRMFYSFPGSRWLTVHDLQHWMINGKKAHFIHRPAYLSAAHWYSCWKCGEKHSWMYGCGLHWRGFDIELFCSAAILLRSFLCIWCSQVDVQVSKPTSWLDKMLQTMMSSIWLWADGKLMLHLHFSSLKEKNPRLWKGLYSGVKS